jgi:hypothetical protein
VISLFKCAAKSAGAIVAFDSFGDAAARISAAPDPGCIEQGPLDLELISQTRDMLHADNPLRF